MSRNDSGEAVGARHGVAVVPFPWDVSPESGPAVRLRDALSGGQVMVFPTETAYALGGNALLPSVAAAVFGLKGRPLGKALLLLIDGAAAMQGGSGNQGLEGAQALVRDVTPAARHLMEHFWPGPLTLVLRAGPGLPPHLVDERGTVALRWSSHPAVAALLQLGGAPLIGTSANPSGVATPRRLAAVLAALQPPGGAQPQLGSEQHGAAPRISLAVDGGELPAGEPSTIVDTTCMPFRVLREGAISAAQLRLQVPQLG